MCKWIMYKRARIPMFLWERHACANSGAQAVFPRPRKNGLGTRLTTTVMHSAVQNVCRSESYSHHALSLHVIHRRASQGELS